MNKPIEIEMLISIFSCELAVCYAKQEALNSLIDNKPDIHKELLQDQLQILLAEISRRKLILDGLKEIK